jgi:16S rRNA (adenine1518-N6/adenine1519-N6)-dimethyltransferase
MVIRKRFGQHFLHDPAVIRRILDAVEPKSGERVVELGPGRGALTFGLLERAGRLDAIEIDRDLARLLEADPRAQGRLQLHVENMLETDFTLLRGQGPKLRIVGNLPYNVSTPVLFHLLTQRGAIEDMHFMLQKEVVDRMAAAPGGKEYGRLTVMLAAYAEVEALFEVGPGAFRPPPRVRSGIVRLRPSTAPRFPIGSDAALRRVAQAAFSHRRKTLRNGLKGLLSGADVEACGIDAQLRPETLTPEQFGCLAVAYERRRAADTLAHAASEHHGAREG